MTPEDREKAIQRVGDLISEHEAHTAYYEREKSYVLAERYVDAILAALSPAEPVQELPVLDPDEQARHEQAMRELAALAFDPNSLDRTEPCPGWWGGHAAEPAQELVHEPNPMESGFAALAAEPKSVEITDEMVQEAQAAYVDVLCNLGERDSTAMRAALEAALSEARTEGGESQ